MVVLHRIQHMAARVGTHPECCRTSLHSMFDETEAKQSQEITISNKNTHATYEKQNGFMSNPDPTLICRLYQVQPDASQELIQPQGGWRVLQDVVR